MTRQRSLSGFLWSWKGGDPDEVVAATRDGDRQRRGLGALTTVLLDSLKGTAGVLHQLLQPCAGLQRDGADGASKFATKKTGIHKYVQAKFVFLGAGGGSLHLLQTLRYP